MRALLDSRLVRSLASVRVGIVLGFAASALLAASSLTIPDPRGEGAMPFSESFEPFLASFEPRYAWSWALAAVLFLFALGVLLSTLRSLVLRRRGTWDMRFAGIVLMHIGVIAGLVTHLAAGLSAKVEETAVLTRAPTPLASRTFVLVDVERQVNPDGSLRTATATVTVDGDRRTLAYNEPVFLDGMRRFVLIQDVRQAAGPSAFTVAGEELTVAPGETFGPAGAQWVLGRTSVHPSLRAPMAVVRPADAPDGWRWIAAGSELAPGLTFQGVLPEPAVAVVLRRNDGVPILLGASGIFTLGLISFLIGRRRPRPRADTVPEG